MSPRVAIVGGGSFQWVPKLVVDLATTPSLAATAIVLHDVDPAPLPQMAAWVGHVAERLGVELTVETTTDRRAALLGADFVVATISTGGFDAMRHDLEIPRRHGVVQSVGDTVGPGGISRALRNIPVFLAIAADVAECCPDAWLLNLTNPMTTLCRAVTRETPVRTVGLCHELTIMRYLLALLLDADLRAVRFDVAGVNHLPLITRCTINGADGFAQLRALLDDPGRAAEPLASDPPAGFGLTKVGRGPHWTRGDLLAANRLKLAIFDRTGVLPGAGDRHVAEFFPGFLTEASKWGKRWGIRLTSIDDRVRNQRHFRTALDRMLREPGIARTPSGELVAPVVDSLLGGRTRHLPVNLPNTGQCPDLPVGAVVESVGTVSAAAIGGGPPVTVPPALAETLRRVAVAQELTVEAAVTGRRDLVLDAMFADPLAGRGDHDRVVRMTDELLAATAPWLPQFA